MRSDVQALPHSINKLSTWMDWLDGWIITNCSGKKLKLSIIWISVKAMMVMCGKTRRWDSDKLWYRSGGKKPSSPSQSYQLTENPSTISKKLAKIDFVVEVHHWQAMVNPMVRLIWIFKLMSVVSTTRSSCSSLVTTRSYIWMELFSLFVFEIHVQEENLVG